MSFIKPSHANLGDYGKLCAWDIIQILTLKLYFADIGGHGKKWPSVIIQTLALFKPYCYDLGD